MNQSPDAFLLLTNIRVGNPGDSGSIQMTDLLFTVNGPTAGVILVEWNVHESKQGSGSKSRDLKLLFFVTNDRISCHVGLSFPSWGRCRL